MPLADIVSVTITATTQTVSRKGFGTILLIAYHTANPDVVRSYKSQADVLVDHAATSVIARATAIIFGQNPRPQLVKIGKRILPPTQNLEVIPVTLTEGFVHKLEITSPLGVVSTMTVTNGAGETVLSLTAKFKTAIDALAIADLTTVDNATDLEINADVAGELFDLEDVSQAQPGANLIKNVTVDPGIATDIAAIRLVDPDWYWTVLDSNSEAEAKSASAALNAFAIMFPTDSSDNEIDNAAVTDDLFSDLDTLNPARTYGTRGKNVLSFIGAATAGRAAPFTPGERKATRRLNKTSGRD